MGRTGRRGGEEGERGIELKNENEASVDKGGRAIRGHGVGGNER